MFFFILSYKQINKCKEQENKMHTYTSKQPRQCGRQNGRRNQPKQPKNRVKTRVKDQSATHVIRSVDITHNNIIRMRNMWIQQGGVW